MNEQFLRIKAVEKMIGCKKTKIWELSRYDPSFARPRKYGRVTIWLRSELESWMAQIAK